MKLKNVQMTWCWKAAKNQENQSTKNWYSLYISSKSQLVSTLATCCCLSFDAHPMTNHRRMISSCFYILESCRDIADIVAFHLLLSKIVASDDSGSWSCCLQRILNLFSPSPLSPPSKVHSRLIPKIICVKNHSRFQSLHPVCSKQKLHDEI